MYCIVLYCIVLYCIVLYCIVLYCIALYFLPFVFSFFVPLIYFVLSCPFLPPYSLYSLCHYRLSLSSISAHIFSFSFFPSIFLFFYFNSIFFQNLTGGRLGHGNNDQCLLPRVVQALGIMDLL